VVRGGRPIDVAICALNGRVCRSFTVRSPRKVVQGGQSPARCYFEYSSIAESAPISSRSVEVTIHTERQAAGGGTAVNRVEAVQHAERPLGRDLEHRAEAVCSPLGRRSTVQVA